MSVACFDQIEGILELVNPLRALTPSGSRTPRTPRTNWTPWTPRTQTPRNPTVEAKADQHEGESPVVVPPTIVCRAKGDGVPLGLLCRVARRGDLLMLGCHRTGKLTGVRMLKNASVEITSPGVIEIYARSAPSLVLRFDTAQEAEYWAADFRGCPTQPPTPRGMATPRIGASVMSTPRVQRPFGSQPQGDGIGLSPWMAGGALDAPSVITAGRHRSKESASTCSGVGTTRSTRASTRRIPRRTAKENTPDTTNSEEDNSSDLEGWVEAQTARSSRLMQLFEKEHRRMEATADDLADQRLLIERKSRTIDVLEAEEAEHQQGLDKLQEVVAQLSSRCQKVEDGPQYFYIGDSEVETHTLSPSSTAGTLSMGETRSKPMIPQLKLPGGSSSIEQSVARAEDAWEARRRVLQQQAEERAQRRAGMPDRIAEAVRKAPLLSPRRPRRQTSSSSQSLREAHGMMMRQLSPQMSEDTTLDSPADMMALPGEPVDPMEAEEDFPALGPATQWFQLEQEPGAEFNFEFSMPSQDTQAPVAHEPAARSAAELNGEPAAPVLESLEPVLEQEPAVPVLESLEPALEQASQTPRAEEPAEVEASRSDEAPEDGCAGTAEVSEAEVKDCVLEDKAEAAPEERVQCPQAAEDGPPGREESEPLLLAESSDAGSWSRMVSDEDDQTPRMEGVPAAAPADVTVAKARAVDAEGKSFAWVPNKLFPRSSSGSQKSSHEVLPEATGQAHLSVVSWVVPEPMPPEPMEDSELLVALEKRRQQVEQARCEFTKEGIHSRADVPRSSPRANVDPERSKFRTTSK